MQRHVRPALRQLVDIEHKTVIVKRTTGERAGIRLAQSTNRMAAEQCRAIARAIRIAARVTNDESSAETGAARLQLLRSERSWNLQPDRYERSGSAERH